jgi:nucleoside-diphosphate-sugar epimerase
MNTLLIAGLGDIARRALPQLRSHFRIYALLRPERMIEADAFPEVRGVPGDLDQQLNLDGIAAPISHVVHLAPPPATGRSDPHTAHLLSALAARMQPPRRLVYISTSGVYGDCGGDWIDEERPVNPMSDRARRRVDAERRIGEFANAQGTQSVILRVPGIYAAERLPIERLRRATPVLRAEDDVYTNHIHADDLAQVVVAALTHVNAEGIFNACDDSALKMGDWFDLVADRAGLPRPPRIARSEACARIAPPLYSFMSESRRLVNARMKRVLGVKLDYPTVYAGVPALRTQ